MRQFKSKMFLVFIFSLMMLVASCSSKPATVTVIFNSNGGLPVEPMTLNVGKPFSLPLAPTKEGYQFLGWYLENVTFTTPFNTTYDLSKVKAKSFDVFAKWQIKEYTITFVTNGGSTLEPIKHTILTTNVASPTEPTKQGFSFGGWFRDASFSNAYLFSTPTTADLTLYAKWVENTIVQDPRETEVLKIFSAYYGNTNGNLNNKGLAVFDNKKLLHYVSVNTTLYSFNPETKETLVLFSLISGGRPTYLNMDGDILYFIDSHDGHMLSYHLVNKVISLISEENISYISRTQTWVNVIYPSYIYEQNLIAFQRYLTNNKDFSDVHGYGYEQMNIDGTRVYYKPLDTMALYLANYNGQGKTTIVNLVPLGVTRQFETLLYKVDQDYTSYFALILEIDSVTSLYLYNSKDGLIKVMNSSVGGMHSLNFDGKYVYVINGSSVYQVDLETKTPVIIHGVSAIDSYLNIINHWLYVGEIGSTKLYRINPVTNEIENIIK